jgi:hypothetical protein
LLLGQGRFILCDLFQNFFVLKFHRYVSPAGGRLAKLISAASDGSPLFKFDNPDFDVIDFFMVPIRRSVVAP